MINEKIKTIIVDCDYGKDIETFINTNNRECQRVGVPNKYGSKTMYHIAVNDVKIITKIEEIGKAKMFNVNW